MNYDLFRVRTQRLVEFTILCNRIVDRSKKTVPTNLISGLRDFGLSLTAMKEDIRLKEIAEKHLVMLDEVVAYAKAKNAGSIILADLHYAKSRKIHDECDVLMDALADKLEERGTTISHST